MALPENRLSSLPVIREFLDPDGRTPRNPLEDYERGGIAIQDPSQGLDVRTWKITAKVDGIWIQSYQAETPWLIIPGEEINYVSLAFDNNMNICICYRQLEVVKLYWYDTTVQEMVITEFPEAFVGCVTLDDKRAWFSSLNDVLFFYIRDEGLYYRQQRDRYQIERFLAPLPSQYINVVPAYSEENYCEPDYTGMYVKSFAPALQLNAGMTLGYRVQIEVVL